MVDMMKRYWEDHPPLHMLVAAFMGYEKKKSANNQSPDEVKNMLARLGISKEN